MTQKQQQKSIISWLENRISIPLLALTYRAGYRSGITSNRVQQMGTYDMSSKRRTDPWYDAWYQGMAVWVCWVGAWHEATHVGMMWRMHAYASLCTCKTMYQILSVQYNDDVTMIIDGEWHDWCRVSKCHARIGGGEGKQPMAGARHFSHIPEISRISSKNNLHCCRSQVLFTGISSKPKEQTNEEQLLFNVRTNNSRQNGFN